MEKVKRFTTDFVGFYLVVFIEAFKIAYSLFTYSIRGMVKGITNIAVPLAQQTVEIITHISIFLYHETLLLTSSLLIKLSQFCMQISRNLHNQARYIQNNYRWL